jgi:hypothetical protein
MGDENDAPADVTGCPWSIAWAEDFAEVKGARVLTKADHGQVPRTLA